MSLFCSESKPLSVIMSFQLYCSVIKVSGGFPVLISLSSCECHLPRGDGGHGGVLVAVPHSVVVADLPGGDERRSVISQQPLAVCAEQEVERD